MNAIRKYSTARAHTQQGSNLNKSNDCHSMSLERTAGHINISVIYIEWMPSKIELRFPSSCCLLCELSIICSIIYSKDRYRNEVNSSSADDEKKTTTKTSEINGIRLLLLWWDVLWLHYCAGNCRDARPFVTVLFFCCCRLLLLYV